MVFFPSVARDADAIVARVRDFFTHVLLPLLPFDDCVVDFSATAAPDRPLRIIEFNPFTKFTSAVLFDWQRDRDVLEGRLPFELRIVREPLPVLRSDEGRLCAAGGGDEMSRQLLAAGVSSEVLAEQAGALDALSQYLKDDMARIESNLRYTLRSTLRP
eukprot:TRINITY_DN4931_c0_g1_i2.p2 TRINITY_DN4931_c0_g1~~TRINITY_DN4931_c0_g1_i2.p2  ORF type:complete len:159 (+),score=51.99 TRINITY_DN4931_c0_g1_i2:899-1375(+)